MSDLKPGWQRVKFGDVVRQVKDKVDPETSGLKRFVAGEHMETDDLRIRSWGDIGDGYLGPAFHMRFRPGQVLYGSRRTYLRKVAVADFEGICANTTFILETANSNELLPEFLPYIMTTEAFHEHSKRESKGSVNPYVNFSDLAWHEFALPPLEEQQRIGALLRRNLETRERYWEAIAATDILAASQLLSDTERLRRYKSAPLSDLVVDNGPICYGVVQPGDVVTTGVRMIRVCDIDVDGQFAPANEIALVSAQVDSQYRRSRVNSGDIVVSVVGTIGRVARIPPGLSGSNIARALARVRIDPSQVDPEFVARLLRSPYWQQKLTADSFETARKTLNIGVLDCLQIPVPPQGVQRDFVERWSAVEDARLHLSRRFNSLMQQQSLSLSRSGLQ